jgi:two-component system, LytTR family, response regulator
MAIRTVVVDDNEVDLELATCFVNKLDFLDLKAKLQNPLQLYPLLQSTEIDLLICDVEMPQISGLDLIKALDKTPHVVLMTSYPDFALQGFELDAVDYLVKPFSFDRFLKSMYKVSKTMGINGVASTENMPANDHFFIRSEQRYVKIQFSDVLYIEALKDYVKVVTHTQSYLAALNLKALEDNLPTGEFMRIHRSYIVNLSHIAEVSNTDIYLNGVTIPVGESYKAPVYNDIVSARLIRR